jgi:hypothetical protein
MNVVIRSAYLMAGPMITVAAVVTGCGGTHACASHKWRSISAFPCFISPLLPYPRDRCTSACSTGPTTRRTTGTVTRSPMRPPRACSTSPCTHRRPGARNRPAPAARLPEGAGAGPGRQTAADARPAAPARHACRPARTAGERDAGRRQHLAGLAAKQTGAGGLAARAGADDDVGESGAYHVGLVHIGGRDRDAVDHARGGCRAAHSGGVSVNPLVTDTEVSAL